jgi:hypothetical protein
MQGNDLLTVVGHNPGRTEVPMTPREQFDRDGYLTARGMFTAEEMAEFIREVQKGEPLTRGADFLDSGSMHFYRNVFYKNPVIQRFVCQQRVIDFLVPVVGPDFWMR